MTLQEHLFAVKAIIDSEKGLQDILREIALKLKESHLLSIIKPKDKNDFRRIAKSLSRTSSAKVTNDSNDLCLNNVYRKW